MPAWARPARWSTIKDGQVTLLDRYAEAAFRRATASPHPRHAAARTFTASGPPDPAPTAATTPTTAARTPRLAKAVGKPVRLQYMRDQGTGWDPKAPASIHQARAAIDAAGNVIAYDFLSKGFSRVDVDTNGSKPYDTLAGQLSASRSIPATVSACRRNPTTSPTSARVGNHRAAARPRLAAAHLAPARSGRTADPFRQRILHG